MKEADGSCFGSDIAAIFLPREEVLNWQKPQWHGLIWCY